MEDLGITVVSEPETTDEIILKQSCKLGAPPQNLDKITNCDFVAGSLVFECTDFAEIFTCLDFSKGVPEIASLLDLNKRVTQRVGDRRCYHSLYSLLFGSFMQPEFASYISHTNLYRFLGTTFHCSQKSIIFVDTPYVMRPIKDWMSIFPALQRISMEMKDMIHEASLKHYELIVEELMPLPIWIQDLIEKTIELRCGSLMYLATKMTLTCINWIMNKLKLTSSSNFMYQLFCSPSLMGKCTALLQMLEIHEVLWTSSKYSKIEDMIPTLYTILEWLFEKCKLLKNKAIEGFTWVKAKFRKADNEQDMCPNLKKELPEVEAQCSVEEKDFPIIHKFVSKKTFVDSIMFNFVQAQAGCEYSADLKVKSYNNNCIFNAVEPDFAKARALRDETLKYTLENFNNLILDSDETGFTADELSSELNQLIHQLVNGLQIADIVLIPLEHVLKKKIFMADILEERYVRVQTTSSTYEASIWIFNTPGHYRTGYPIKHDMCLVLAGTDDKECKCAVSEKTFPGLLDTPPTVEAVKEETKKTVNESIPKVIVPEKEAEKVIEGLESTEMGRSFLDWLKDITGDSLKFFKENAIIGGVVAFCFSIASGLGLTISKFKTYGDKRSFWENLSGASRDFYYLSRGQDSMCKVFKDFGSVLKDMIGLDDDPEITKFKELLVDTADKADEMNKICSYNPEKIVNDPQQLCILKDAVDNVKKRYHELVKINPTVNLQVLIPVWNRLTAATVQLEGHYQQLCQKGSRRVKPVCIWLYGKSNIGKTEYAQHILNQINIQNGTMWDAYTISHGPDYLNGYKQQNVIIIDDFDAVTTVNGETDAVHVMNFVTQTDYNPNIANLEDKSLRARPKLLIICSNYPTCKLDCGVNDLAAFERRRDFVLHVEWNGDHNHCPEDSECAHWDDINKKMLLDEKLAFDHLTMKKVSNRVWTHKEATMPVHKKGAKTQTTFGSVIMSVPNLVDQVIKKIEMNEAVYKFQMKALKEVEEQFYKNQVSVTPQADSEALVERVTDWATTPNILLRGRPGLGKSCLMKKVFDRLNKLHKKVTYITTKPQYETFAQGNFSCNESEFVIFDDYTTWKNSTVNEKFWTLWKERADGGDDKLPIWILGMNDQVAMDAFSSLEEFEVMTRSDRATSFMFSFKPVPSYLSLVYQKFYTEKDLKNLKDKKYDDVVKIMCEDKQFMSVLVENKLVNWTCKRQGKFEQEELMNFEVLKIDAYSTLDVDTKEFLDLINGTGTFSKAFSIVTGGTFKSQVLSKQQMSTKLLTTFQEMRQHKDVNFPDFDSFMLVGANARFFDLFKGYNCVMEFKDIKYALATVNNHVIVGKYNPKNKMQDLGELANIVAESVTGIDFLRVCKNKLPPWFVIASTAAEQIIKFTMTAVAIPNVIKQNKLMFKAMKLSDKLEEVTEQYSDKRMEETVEVQKEKLLGSPFLEPKVISVNQSTDSGRSTPDQKNTGKFVKRLTRLRGKGKKMKAQDMDGEELLCEGLLRDYGADVPKAIAQITTDDSVFTVFKTIYNNMVQFVDLGGKHICSGLIIKGNLGTTVGHLVEIHKESQVKACTPGGASYNVKFGKHSKDEDRLDFEIIKAPPFKDITHHLANPQTDHFQNKVVMMVNFQNINNIPLVTARYFRISGIKQILLENHYSVPSAIEYNSALSGYKSELPSQTTKGDCGGIVLVCDSHQNKKIIGMHIAGDGKSSYFRPLIGTQYPPKVEGHCGVISGPLGEFVPPRYPTKGGYKVVAKCAAPPFIPDKTRLYKSPFAYRTCLYEPAVLSKRDPRADIENLVETEAMKWCAPPSNLNLDVEKINETFAVLGDYYGQKLFVAGIQTSILTKKSALNSCRMYSHSKPIPVGTSAGYPFNQMVYNGKQHLIHIDKETGERRFTNDPELKNLLHQTIDHVLSSAKEDKLADVAFIVFPKDEPLKKDKLKTKVRTIASAPIHLSIALRMYFHTLDAALAELWPVLPLKVGIAPNSLDWHALALYMLEVGDEGFSLDQADFDFNVPQEVNRGVVHTKNAIAKWTDPKWKPEHDKMRIALRENVVKFKIIVGPLVYESQRGVASGQPSTATDNTHISVFFAYDTFKDLAPSWVDNSLTAFFALVRIAAVGDDLFVMVNVLIRDWYNLQTVAEHLTKKYGLKITPSDKSGKFYKTKPLEELDFLSRHFVKDGNYWKGPLKMERLLKPLHYCHGYRAHHWFEEPDKETDDMDTAIAAASSALQEMYFHGKEEYESLRKHIVTINSQVLCNTQEYFPPYEVEHQKYFNMQNYSEKGLYEYVFPTDHTIVSRLTKTKGWIKYRNRRSLIFGDYHWDTKTTGKGLDVPGYLLTLIEQVNNLLLTDFNSVLVNEYQPGGLIPWHKDDEPELDQKEGVACITVIGDGVMEWAEKKDDTMHQKITMLCFPGHCYHMCGKYVTDYYHRRSHHERYTVSLTFRKLLGSSV